MDKAMANAQVYVVQFFGAPLPDEPRRRFFLFSSLAAIYDKFSAAQVGCSLGNLYNLRVSDGVPLLRQALHGVARTALRQTSQNRLNNGAVALFVAQVRIYGR